VKFLCDNCKAKYQIADEKVAGKTVRMKCRKCGHQIEVRAAVTETSVAGAPPDAVRPQARGGLATSLAATKPRAHHSSHPGSALAGAFQRTVQDSIAPDDASLEFSVTDEWYVAINGVPVGPVRISELRRKAASGAVTEDSLVWQEGLEEWRPVRSIAELATIVREAAQGNRPSLLAPEPTRPQPPRAPPQRPAPPARLSEPPPRPSDPSVSRPLAPARSNVVPLHARVATAERLDAPPAPFAAMAPPTPAPPEPAPTPPPTPAPVAVADPFAVPPAPAPPSTSPSFAPPAPAAYAIAEPAARRGGVPLWFWPIMLFVLGFGGVAAFFIFRHPAPAAPVVIQVPTPITPTATVAPPLDEIEDEEIGEAEEGTPTSAKRPPGKVAAKGTPAPPPGPGAKTADLSGLLGGAGGPSVGAKGPSGGSGGGLDSAAVQRVVRERQAGVKRTCWERGGGDGKSSAKVNVSITVAPNGSVQGAKATGDDPVVAKCIENQVRTWHFPAPGETTTVNVPFVFVRQ
jgi:predicted Zn finger-like uncharacterized protein